MNVEQFVDELKKEINGRHQIDVVANLEEIISENAKEISKIENFFKLPLKNIFSVISRINFNSIDESDDGFELLQNIIKNTIIAHYEEKETPLILQNINISQVSLTYERILSLFELFTNCPFFQLFNKLYQEKQQQPEIDYEYEMEQKDKEIEKLKQQNKEIQSQLFLEKPKDYESNIFIACKKGKLTSVQWLIEKKHVDKNKRVVERDNYYEFYVDNTPIHIASKNGHLPIVQYLIEKQNVDIDIKGACDRTPLHCACWNGHLPIVEYLISKGANIEAKDALGFTPLSTASFAYKTDIVKYLVSNGADENVK